MLIKLETDLDEFFDRKSIGIELVIFVIIILSGNCLCCRCVAFNVPGAANSNPLKLFVVLSATAWNFSVKFSIFMWLSYLHLIAKRHLIFFKYDEVVHIILGDYFFAAPGTYCRRWLVFVNRRTTRKPVDYPLSCRYSTAVRATFLSLRRASSIFSSTTCLKLGPVRTLNRQRILCNGSARFWRGGWRVPNLLWGFTLEVIVL